MNKSTQRTLSSINLLFATFLIADYSLPGNASQIQTLDSIYTIQVKTSNGRRPAYENRKILSLTSGATHRIGKLPKNEYAHGQEIQIIKGNISNNVNAIKIIDKNIRTEHVGILSNNYWIFTVFIALIISILALFKTTRAITILLIAAFMFLSIFTIIYFFWF